VQGLDRDRARVEEARRTIRRLDQYGPVSIGFWEGRHLPYAQDLVNLIVVEEAEAPPRGELLRVLAPGGKACLRRGTDWVTLAKDWPRSIDDWGHYLHDATGNAVARDQQVAEPRSLRWLDGPVWSRNHEQMSSFSACVSAGGRLFYIVDEASPASMALPSDWKLVARDAFSGVLLWKRDIASWWPRLFAFKSGPAMLPRRLVASASRGGVADRVFVTLDIDGPLTVLDAATGKTIYTAEGSGRTE
jgi:hypothetical protein